MTKASLKSSLIALACSAPLALATPSMAAMINLKANLKRPAKPRRMRARGPAQ